MASTVWKGYLTFGLISVPVRLFVAARSERISFNQIHDKCGSRIKQQTYCPVRAFRMMCGRSTCWAGCNGDVGSSTSGGMIKPRSSQL